MKRFLIYIICVLASLVAATAQNIAQQADSAYTGEDYRTAIRLYSRIIEENGPSAQIYYNLGNSYYRINDIAKSVLCYQRALNIDPSYRDARVNLKFVKSRIADLPEDDSSFLGNLHDSVIAAMSPNAWAWTALLLFLMLLACIGLYLFTDNIRLRKTGFFGGLVILVLSIYTSTVAYGSASGATRHDQAVISPPTATLRTEPGSAVNDKNRMISLPAGTIVIITDSITMPGETAAPKWYNVKINNSTSAWVNAADVERI